MSIRDIIKEWKRDGVLLPVRREVEIAPPIRRVVACPEVYKNLHGPWSTMIEEKRYQTAKAIIDGFIEGNTMSVRIPPSTAAKARLALLSPSESNVWEFRTEPDKRWRYGVRIFGAFADKDFFVAVASEFKENLLDSSDYIPWIELCKREWRRLFPSYNMNLGVAPHDYISDCVPF